MIEQGDIHVIVNVNYSLDVPFKLSYDTKKFGSNTYLNVLFTHNGQCEFYDYRLIGNVLKIIYKEDNILKHTDILLIYL